MVEGKAAPQRGAPVVIDRPRLRALLDESPSRVILLIAPPGYGKTTLAQQWLARQARSAAWYTCTLASADVAAFALGLAKAGAATFPGGSARLEKRLKASPTAAQSPATLVELLTEMTSSDGEQAWLVLDDYHHVMHSAPAEDLVARLINSEKISVLVASRRRPTWASARKLLYDEVREIPRDLLAMTRDEAAEVLKEKGPHVPTLIQIADGWPAVIGLAARSAVISLPTDKLAPQLYDFFAQELYQAAPTKVRRDLHRLAMLPTTTAPHLRLVFQERAETVVDELVRIGFLTSSTERAQVSGRPVDLHPLVRDFLADKLAALPDDLVRTEATEIARRLCRSGAWDDAFAVIRRFELVGLLPGLLEEGLESLLEQGRAPTVEQWLELAHQLRLRAPVVELASAELALRRGAWREALTLASTAGETFPEGHFLISRAFNCAARAAHFSDKGHLAVRLHTRARAFAQRPQDVRESLWGKFVAESEIDLAGDARSTLDEYETLTVCDGDDLLRRTTGRLVLAVRHGPLHHALRIAPATASVLSSADDPITRTGFLQMYTYALALAGRYQESYEVAVTEVELAQKYDLEFIEIHALCALAAAEIGRRQFASAEAALDRAHQKLRRVDDVHAEMAVSASRMKIGLIRGDDALLLGETDRVWTRAPNSGIQGSLFAIRGLVYVRKGNYMLARRSAESAQRITSQLEAQLAANCVYAACAVEEQNSDAAVAASDAFETALAAGAFDPFVLTYRSFPNLLGLLVGTTRHEQLTEVIHLAGDRDIGIQRGILTPSLPQTLSRREREVLELLGHGLSNRAIAKALWISESTAKVHVRHIFDKLKVRTRTEAALVAQDYLPDGSSD